jgi:glycerol-3-phosphate dehydrogenase
LEERNLLLQNAPHFVSPLPTMIPIYHWFSGIINGIRKFIGLKANNTSRGVIIVKLGLMMYDIFTRNHRVMPTHSFTNRKKSLKERPILDPKIVYTGLFYDAWISYPERLGIELIQDTLLVHPESKALNYVSLNGIQNENVVLKDELSGEIFTVKPQVVVNATGAWIDFANSAFDQKTKFIGGTKGSHLMIDNQALMDATLGQMVYYENDEGRICILFPLHGKVMVGSTDIKIIDPETAVCTDDEVEYMLGCVKQVFPKINIDPSQIVFRYSGVRPLPNSEGDLKNAQISRDHSTKIIEPSDERHFPILNLIGGKWTTFRAFGEQTADKVLSYLNKPRKMCSRNLPIGGGKDFPKTDDEKQFWVEQLYQTSGIDKARVQTLLFRFGTTSRQVVNYLIQDEDQPLKNKPEYSKREIEFLLKNEFVQHLDDLILRRTSIALAGELTYPLLVELADIQMECFGFSQERKEYEISRSLEILARKHHVFLDK